MSKAKWFKVIGASAAVFVFLVAVSQCDFRSDPMSVCKKAQLANTAGDVEANSDYYTSNGKAVMLWLISRGNGRPMAAERPVYSSPVINGDVCDIHGRQKNVEFTIRLLNSGGWQFHDIYFESIGTKRVDLWVSYMKDHPIGTWWSMNQDELADSFFRDSSTDWLNNF